MDNDGKQVNPKALVELDQSTTTTTIITPTSSVVVVEKESCSLGLSLTTTMDARISKSHYSGSGVEQEESVQDEISVVGRYRSGADVGIAFGDGDDVRVAKESLGKDGVGIEKSVGENEKGVDEVELGEEIDGGGAIGDVVLPDSEKVCGRKGFGLKFQDGVSSSGRKPFAEVPSSIAQRTRNRIVSDKEEGNVGQNGSDIGDEIDEGNSFSVGDFVWGKVKSHPWWPGRIYDPSNASELALKYKHEGRLLVAYFGDRSFAWCDPSQLKSFEENFEEFSKLSSLKTFVSAVQEAENEFGRLVKKQITCSCIRESQSSLPLVVNAGITEGVHVPENSVAKFSVSHIESSTVLADVRCLATFDLLANTLELAVLKSQLSAFYCAKFGYSLPIYCEPIRIEDPMNEQAVPREALFRGPDDGDWLIGSEDQILGQNGPLTPHNMLQNRRKSKTVAELLGLDSKAELEKNMYKRGESQSVEKSKKKRGKVSDVDQSSMHEVNGDDYLSKDEEQLKLMSGRRKRKTVDESQSHIADNVMSTRSSKRKKKEDLARLTASDEKASGDTEDVGEVKDQQKTGMVSQVNINGDPAVQEGYERISPRERKLSKYLSPPYTYLLQRQRSSFSQIGSEAGLAFSDVAQMGPKTAGKLVGSPSIVTCSAESFRKSSKVSGSKLEKTDHPDNNTSKPDLKSEANGPVKSIGSLDGVLFGIRSAALDPLYTGRDQTFDSIKGFLSSYRSSNYKNGPNYKSYEVGGAYDQHRKRKRNLSGTILSGTMHRTDPDPKVLNEIDQQTPKLKRFKRSATKSEQKLSGTLNGSDSIQKGLNEVDQQAPQPKRSIRSATKSEQKFYGTLNGSDSIQKVLNGVDQQTPKPRRSIRSATTCEQKVSSQKALNVVGYPKRFRRSATKSVPKSSGTIQGSDLDQMVLNEVDQKTPTLKRSKRSATKKEQKVESKPDHEVSCGPSSSSATLEITFPAGSSLPTKENIIEMCCKFGDLDESKTEVVSESSSAKIVFVQSSVAEAAMDSMQKSGPFGNLEVSYKIEHLAAVPVSKGKYVNVQNKKKMKTSEKTGAVFPDKHLSVLPSPESEPLTVIFIKQKLEAITDMLGQTDGKMSQEIKSNLENDVKDLLKMVKRMTAVSSSS